MRNEAEKQQHNNYMKAYWVKYSKTKKGFVQRLYTKMKSRIKGTHGHNNHLYVGKEILDKEVFYHWIASNNEFNKLFIQWGQGGYKRSDVPTIDRLNSAIGYTIDNIEVVTFTENVKRSNQ